MDQDTRQMYAFLALGVLYLAYQIFVDLRRRKTRAPWTGDEKWLDVRRSIGGAMCVLSGFFGGFPLLYWVMSFGESTGAKRAELVVLIVAWLATFFGGLCMYRDANRKLKRMARASEVARPATRRV